MLGLGFLSTVNLLAYFLKNVVKSMTSYVKNINMSINTWSSGPVSHQYSILYTIEYQNKLIIDRADFFH